MRRLNNRQNGAFRPFLTILAFGLLATPANAIPQVGADQKSQMLSASKPPAPTSTLPPAPPLPAGCAAPTKEQCSDANWYRTDRCATTAASKQGMLDYCTWVFKKEWHAGMGAGHTTLFPVTPPNSLYPIIAPARKIDRGRNVIAQPTNRPMGKRRFAGSSPPPPGAGSNAGPLRSANWTPVAARPGGGSYTAMTMGHTASGHALIQRDMDTIEISKVNDPLAISKATSIFNTLTMKPRWVQSPGAVVNSCEEFAYKRWGDYSAFSTAAKELGRNWRQVYSLATDPSSPVFVNKLLNQTGTNTPTPLQLIDRLTGYHWDDPNVKPNEKPKRFHDIYLPSNIFFLVKPTWLSKPGMPVTPQQKQSIEQKLAVRRNVQTNTVAGIRVKSDTTPLGIHREAKARFDSVYGNPHDDELADISRRTKAYQDLVAKRATAMVDLVCAGANDPCFRCSTGPNMTGANRLPGALQRLKEQIGGDPVINPADMTSVFQSGNPVQRLHSLIALQRMAPGLVELENQIGSNVAQNATPRMGTGGTSLNMGGAGFTSSNSCIAGLVAQKSALEAEIKNAELTMTRLLVNELSYNDRGCLADAGGNVNICDWSYEMFASEVSTLLDADAEKTFKECRAEIANASQAANVTASGAFQQIVKSPPKQELVFPCVQRRDFTATAPEVQRFMELNGNYLARNCEVLRQQSSIQEQQRAIAGEMTGLKWKPSDGEIYDDAVDSLDLGSKDSVGAYFDYGSSWKLKKNLPLANGSDPMSTCRFEGSAKSKISAGIYFFGDTLELFKLDGDGSARTENNAPKVVVSASSSYFDLNTFSRKTIFNDQNRSTAGETYAPQTPPSINLGGGEVDFWVTIGPIPIHVVFGAVATAGIQYKFAGSPGNNCADLNKPTNFRLSSTIEPWVRADAYADASIDVVVASAGVRLDLLLMRLGIPLGVDVGNTQGTTWTMRNGGRVTIDMLSGRLTGYVEVGVSPLEESWEAEIFGWDGFHTDVATWGLDKSLSNAVIRTALAGSVTYNTVKCDCAATYCCSMLGCPTNNCPGMKKPNGVNRICSFSAADAQAIQNMPNATTDNALCSQFVYP